jgi:hypothetical protein
VRLEDGVGDTSTEGDTSGEALGCGVLVWCGVVVVVGVGLADLVVAGADGVGVTVGEYRVTGVGETVVTGGGLT